MRIQQTSAYSAYNSRPQNKARNENRVGFGIIKDKDALALLGHLPKDLIESLKSAKYMIDAKVVDGKVRGVIDPAGLEPNHPMNFSYKLLADYLRRADLRNVQWSKAVENCMKDMERNEKAGLSGRPLGEYLSSDPLPKSGIKEEDLYQ